ncbi:unnamed protein product [Chondrus crispus]|uniref:Uncharacterized protein n=1 Tax=Chondrus crispus TaxID=2769 RepID=R7QH60_CHOCR|nr:unnamed protein product [Chondrus crispus]CDF37078.1 unnamed protein product [Chondrus crispus]|eukprot:XP_005716897.1 unnamed protein product [Chondrus crispus]
MDKHWHISPTLAALEDGTRLCRILSQKNGLHLPRCAFSCTILKCVLQRRSPLAQKRTQAVLSPSVPPFSEYRISQVLKPKYTLIHSSG